MEFERQTPRPPDSRWREIALAVAIACGAIQTMLVYADPGGPDAEPLSPAAARGQAIWNRHNCNACHQLYGFGGFLGPDLTNLASRYSPDDVSTVLDRGRNRMPAFGFDRQAQRDLWAFFEALDRSGRGQPAGIRSRAPQPPERHFAALTAAASADLPPPVAARLARGAELMTQWSCGACHTPLEPGRFQAPDLSLVAAIRSRAELAAVIGQGRNTMPGFPIAGDDLDALIDHLMWMNDRRDDLVRANDRLCDREPFRFGEVPWFAYR